MVHLRAWSKYSVVASVCLNRRFAVRNCLSYLTKGQFFMFLGQIGEKIIKVIQVRRTDGQRAVQYPPSATSLRRDNNTMWCEGNVLQGMLSLHSSLTY